MMNDRPPVMRGIIIGAVIVELVTIAVMVVGGFALHNFGVL